MLMMMLMMAAALAMTASWQTYGNEATACNNLAAPY
jgi:hypothetical protein